MDSEVKGNFMLRIEHQVMDFATWKQAFDNDPANRRQGGVVRYRVNRLINNPNYVVIDLEFETIERLESFLALLQKIWPKVEGKIIDSPKAHSFAIVEAGKF